MSNSCFSFKLPQLNSLSLRRGNSRTSLQQTSPENPYCVVIDFSSVTEKECGKLDAINEKKYNKLIQKANKAERTIHRTGLSMNLEFPLLHIHQIEIVSLFGKSVMYPEKLFHNQKRLYF